LVNAMRSLSDVTVSKSASLNFAAGTTGLLAWPGTSFQPPLPSGTWTHQRAGSR
jgi:hypothetical protein